MAAAPHPSRRQTVRVDAERLDALMHLMGEMVVQRTRLESIAHASGDALLAGAVADLARVAQSLQAMVMQVRMVPVESVFMRFPRMVRDLAAKLDKQVDLHIQGEDTELDRTVVEALGDPLVHLIRNALDHGLETPEQREAAGKGSVGTLQITAEHAGGDVVITVRDDGRGVNAGKVAEIAARRGLIEEPRSRTSSVEEAIELLFAPGFSTAEVATDVSGRGVGMDAVRSMVRNLGGDASMTSVPGEGSCATLRLPLTLAILPALLVDVEGAAYALPLDRVEQAIRIADYNLRSVNGQYAITLRDKILPLYDLGECLGYGGVDPSTANAVVVRARRERRPDRRPPDRPAGARHAAAAGGRRGRGGGLRRGGARRRPDRADRRLRRDRASRVMADRRTMVRMAEHAVSKDGEEVLVTLGLGSCIGCALIDQRREGRRPGAHRAAGVLGKLVGRRDGAPGEVRQHRGAPPRLGARAPRRPQEPAQGGALRRGPHVLVGRRREVAGARDRPAQQRGDREGPEGRRDPDPGHRRRRHEGPLRRGARRQRRRRWSARSARRAVKL